LRNLFLRIQCKNDLSHALRTYVLSNKTNNRKVVAFLRFGGKFAIINSTIINSASIYSALLNSLEVGVTKPIRDEERTRTRNLSDLSPVL